MAQYTFFLNTASGTSNLEALQNMLTKAFASKQHHYALVELDGDSAFEEVISHAIGEHQPNVVVACGGDGTVATVAHIASDHNLPLGIIPMGTANIFSKSLDIPDDWEAALTLVIDNSHQRKLDAMRCFDRLYFLHITIGISSLITYRTPQDEKKRFGVFAYLFRIARFLSDPHRKRFHVTIDKKEQHSIRSSEVVIANTDIFFSRAFRLRSGVHMDDGLMNLLAFSPLKWWHHFHFLLYFLFGGPRLTRQELIDLQGKEFHIETVEEPHVIMADGEVIGKTPATITLLPGVISVIAPQA